MKHERVHPYAPTSATAPGTDTAPNMLSSEVVGHLLPRPVSLGSSPENRGPEKGSPVGLQLLRERTSGPRRIFALAHREVSVEAPVAFIHVALMDRVPARYEEIQAATESTGPDHAGPRCAVFYSVTSPFRGLSGIDVAQSLIHCVSAELMYSRPTLRELVTFSPIPGFRRWLLHGLTHATIPHDISVPLQALQHHHQRQHPSGNNPLEAALANASGHARGNTLGNTLETQPPMPAKTLAHISAAFLESQSEDVRNALVRACALYLSRTNAEGYLLDPVAHFHYRNGARLHRINWLGCRSPAFLQESFGITVNYRYEPDRKLLDHLARQYILHGHAKAKL